MPNRGRIAQSFYQDCTRGKGSIYTLTVKALLFVYKYVRKKTCFLLNLREWDYSVGIYILISILFFAMKLTFCRFARIFVSNPIYFCCQSGNCCLSLKMPVSSPSYPTLNFYALALKTKYTFRLKASIFHICFLLFYKLCSPRR